MICPKCAAERTVVKATISDTLTQRWRRCPECGYRFVTVELPNYDDSIKEYIKDVFGEEIIKKRGVR